MERGHPITTLAFFFFAMMAFSASGQLAFLQDFRKSQWGDSQDKVVATEGSDYQKRGVDTIVYTRDVKILGTLGQRRVYYSFDLGKLIEGRFNAHTIFEVGRKKDDYS